MTDGFLGYTDDGKSIIECWNCDEGWHANCIDDGGCLDPEEGCDLCRSRCDICGGKGSYEVDPATPVQGDRQ